MSARPKMVVPTAWQMGLLLLARAMELGMRKTRKLKRKYVGPGPSACALGAAWINGGKVSDGRNANRGALQMRFPVLQTLSRDADNSLFGAIVNRNDSRDWSRGKIVRWLRRLARAQEPPQLWDDVA